MRIAGDRQGTGGREGEVPALSPADSALLRAEFAWAMRDEGGPEAVVARAISPLQDAAALEALQSGRAQAMASGVAAGVLCTIGVLALARSCSQGGGASPAPANRRRGGGWVLPADSAEEGGSGRRRRVRLGSGGQHRRGRSSGGV